MLHWNESVVDKIFRNDLQPRWPLPPENSTGVSVSADDFLYFGYEQGTPSRGYHWAQWQGHHVPLWGLLVAKESPVFGDKWRNVFVRLLCGQKYFHEHFAHVQNILPQLVNEHRRAIVPQPTTVLVDRATRAFGFAAEMAASVGMKVWLPDYFFSPQFAGDPATRAARAALAVKQGQLNIIAPRALEVCIGLQSLHLPALVTLHIVQTELDALWNYIPFHLYWHVVTRVKHFRK